MPYVDHIYYESTGTGPDLLLLHCPALSHAYWRPAIERLQSLCRCTAADIRGHGKSGLRGQPWTFSDIAGDLVRLTRSLRMRRPIVMGYSSSTTIALQAALQAPDLFGGLILVGGLSECTTLYLRSKVRAGLLAVQVGLTPLVGRAIAYFNSADPTHYRQQLPLARSVSRAALASFFRETLSRRLTERLHEVRAPVLLVNGQKDGPMYPYYRKMRAGLGDVRSVFVPGVGHHIPTQKPEDFADVVAQFVADVTHPDNHPLPPGPPSLEWQPAVTEHMLHP